MDDSVEIQILQLPVAIHTRVAEHNDELMREFHLLSSGDTESTPARLIALAAELRSRYGGFTAAQTAQLDSARQAGTATIDLRYRLPPSVIEAVVSFTELLDEADEFCRQGRLMTLATPPDAVAYRRWFLNEFAAQLGGQPPTPWPESEFARAFR